MVQSHRINPSRRVKLTGGSNTQPSSFGTQTTSHQLAPTTSNLFVLLAFLGPYILISFFGLMSLFNQNLKGIIYLIGIALLTMVLFFINPLILPPLNKLKSCYIFGLNNVVDIPSFSIGVYTYTFTYLLASMIRTRIFNIVILTTLLLLIAVDLSIKTRFSCTNIQGLFTGSIFGFVVGLCMFFLISSITTDLLYFSEYVTDKQVCTKPSKQKFACHVYKNGELIQ